MMALQFFVVLVGYPETKGLSLEEMQKKLGIA
jgi:SP family arabinose:H+ symporter-like MFS transporter